MSKNHFIVAFTLMLSFALITPSVFLTLPQRAHAQLGVPTFEMNPAITFTTPVTSVKTTISAFTGILTQVNTFLTQIAAYAEWVNSYILQPMAFVLSGNLMKMLTAGVVQFVIGKANGTGMPQFTVDVQKSMQLISDAKRRGFVSQVGLTGSPFAYSISSALNTDYLTKSSLKGFWAANMCTLKAGMSGIPATANVSAYLRGNWSQGGTAAWFALTTQSQNNPYMLYQNTQSQLAGVITSATGARQQELSWGQGFMSWCSPSDAATKTQNAAVTAYQTCMANGGSGDTCQATFEDSGGLMTSGAVNPGDPCTAADGTTGTIQTPGSTIKATLDKVLGGQQDKLVQMGNISSQITGILANISKIMQTVNLASDILGGGSSGGLLNAGQPSGHLAQFGAPTAAAVGSAGYGGITSTSIKNNATAADAAATAASAARAAGAAADAAADSASSNVLALDMTARAQLYQTSWNTIGTAATSAKTSVMTLINTCTTNAAAADPSTQSQFIVDSTAQVVAAQAAINTLITPVLTQAANAPTIAAAAIAQDTKVKQELASSASYTADLQTLQTMAPTIADTTSAQLNAKTFGTAIANPVGSLTVTPSASYSTVSQMNLISANAKTLETTVCTPPIPFEGGA